MTLKVNRVRLRDFRNYQVADIAVDDKLTVLVGQNATGKTNIIEAMQLLTAAESFRRPPWGELVRWGASEAKISLEASGGGRSLNIELAVSEASGRSYKVNGTPKRRMVDVRGIVPSIVFTPDDLTIVKGPAERRRAMLDSIGQQLSPAYGSLRRDYDKVVRQRNVLLKEAAGKRELEVWTERLTEVGARLTAHRVRLLSRITKEAEGVHFAVAGGQTLSVRYAPSWSDTPLEATQDTQPEDLIEQITAGVQEKANEEAARGVSLVGPHRDDVIFEIDGHDARAFASQGQQRSVALSLKLAEVNVVTALASSPPILLLDDVMSELDEGRRHELTRFVDGAAQTVVTTTNLHYFEPELLEGAAVIEVGR